MKNKKSLYLIIFTAVLIIFNYLFILIPLEVQSATYTALAFVVAHFIISSKLSNLSKLLLVILTLVGYVLLYYVPVGNLFGDGNFC
ncbi:hypothetical protein [Miniphocaeibacter massiliensis]|uniref:hypothetical protein n=1 Tax=Miniphocaeibacter massiliensis TaxID=2041841 RepID=UPI000C1BF064|nr:hypothetical protein [Miniphocaeibacter massiliensis]